ncbi:Tetratricopeptide repeat-domain-containing protein [Baffinella frigidus]|nr:Tetratricopeptide repeat-domain-containing protein [Cryptophyta sp. CCMP2293]
MQQSLLLLTLIAAASAFSPPAALPPSPCSGISSTMLLRSCPLRLAPHGSSKRLPPLRRALVTMKKGGAKDADDATSCFNKAGVHEKKFHYDEALALYQKAVDIWIKKYGSEEHADVADCYNNMAALSLQLEKPQEALALFKKSQDIRIKVFGPDHPDVVVAQNNMKAVYNTGTKTVVRIGAKPPS